MFREKMSPTNSPWYRNKKVEWGKTNYQKYLGTKKKIKERSIRNSARKKMEKAGKVSKGDGMEVDHKKWIKSGNGKKNLRVISRKTNRVLWAAKANRKKSSLYI